MTMLKELDNNEFNISTDGSYDPTKRNQSEEALLGAGWIIHDEDDPARTDMSFQCTSSLWPSSTRAELLSIWTALMVLPEHATVTIHTDSQASIDGIKLVLNGQLTTRAWLKLTNGSILSNIYHIVNTCHLTLKLRKVQGHSNDYWNDRADILAKDAIRLAQNDAPIHICSANIEHKIIALLPTWACTNIDRPIRKFITSLNNNLIAARWSLLAANKDLITFPDSTAVDSLNPPSSTFELPILDFIPLEHMLRHKKLNKMLQDRTSKEINGTNNNIIVINSIETDSIDTNIENNNVNIVNNNISSHSNYSNSVVNQNRHLNQDDGRERDTDSIMTLLENSIVSYHNSDTRHIVLTRTSTYVDLLPRLANPGIRAQNYN